jgi:3-deoxy-D-manno-octulosonic-acid transferase
MDGTRFMRTLYTILYTVGFCLVLPYLLIRGLVNPLYMKTLRARFIGPGKILPKLDNKPRIWVWALSLGEVLSTRELVKQLLAKGYDVVITATTLSGLAQARKLWPTLAIFPSPLDFSLSTRRFLDLVEPDRLILVETDIWPGVLMALERRGIPKHLVSGRLSPKSFKNYKRIAFFWTKIARLFDSISTQSPEDREKFLILGADPAKVSVGGNLKFDQPPTSSTPEERASILQETGWPDGRWIVAGSTHMGEETLILGAFSSLLSKHNDLRILIAPRDRHKFGVNWRIIQELFPWDSAKRTKPSQSDSGARVFLLDTLGELDRFYSLAEVALVGKSWPGPHDGGGHNPLEAAARAKVVLSGPRINNFKWMYKALVAAGAAKIVDKTELTTTLDELLSTPGLPESMGLKGQLFVETHRGAAQETLNSLLPPIIDLMASSNGPDDERGPSQDLTASAS